MTGPVGEDLPAGAFAGALAGLPGMGPARLHTLLSGADPGAVWDAVRRGEIVRPPRARRSGPGDGLRTSWAGAAARVPLAEWWDAWRRRGIGVTWPGDPAYPLRLRADPEPPGVLFWRGRLDALAGRCVAVVGTRYCSPDGRASAYDLGRGLASAGVCVVSGLALGIDGAAHLGALDAPPGPVAPTVGVAASGVDVPYPTRHTALWSRVVAAGAVISENPPGRPAQAWRFPSRNRVIAGLVDLVVVVESHATGGSLITAEKAMDRGVEVRVVPGPVHSPAAAGSNQLLYDGPGPVRDTTDVLDALGILDDRPGPRVRRRRVPRPDQLTLRPQHPSRPILQPALVQPAPSQPARSQCGPPQPTQSRQLAVLRAGGAPSDPVARAVLAAVGERPTSLNRVVERSGVPVGAAGATLDALSQAGLVTEERGWWSRTPHALPDAEGG